MLGTAFKTPKKAYELPKHLEERFALLTTMDKAVVQDTITYMSATEITNVQYREFLREIMSEDSKSYQVAKLDSLNWTETSAHSRPMTELYHWHPAYHGYPAVNMSHKGAELYCNWLQGKLAGQMTGVYNVEVRLPSKSEWQKAASSFDPIFHPYAWGGPNLQNAKGSHLCNYQIVNNANLYRNPKTNEIELVSHDQRVFSGLEGMLYTVSAKSYSPNDKGLYNMNGNVAEMVLEEGIAMGGSWRSPGFDVRNDSEMNYEKSSEEVGFRVIVELTSKYN